MTYSEEDLATLISEVEGQFTEHLKKAEKEQEIKLEKKEEVKEVEMKKSETVEKTFNYDEEDFKEMETLYSSMTKAEADAHYKTLAKVVGVEVEMKKSENTEEVKLFKTENVTLKEENDKLKKSIEGLTDALSKFLKGSKKTAPKQRAITKMEFIPKSSEEIKKSEKSIDISKLNKNEITKKLMVKLRGGKIEKSDRELINGYYDKQVSVEAIKHLL